MADPTALASRPGARVARFIGTALALASLGFVGLQLAQHRHELADIELTRELGFAIGCTVVLHVVAMVLIVVGWRSALGAWLRRQPEAPGAPAFRPVLAVYARSSIAKYLPGNVMHFAGRQILGRWLGLPHGPLAVATLVEQLSVAWVGAMLGLAGACVAWPEIELPLAWMPLAEALEEWLPLVLLGVALAPPLGMLVLRPGGVGPGALRTMVATHFAYFGLLTIGVFACALSVGPIASGEDAVRIGSAFAVAYLAGFLLPGAPGGIGVREAVLTVLLAGVLGEAEAVGVAVIYRVATTLGDFAFAALGWLGSPAPPDLPAEESSSGPEAAADSLR